MNSVRAALENKREGFHIGHRLILPFQCQLIKIMVGGEIYTELVGGKNVKINQDARNTSIYFRSVGKLTSFTGTYKVIKLIVAELNADLCERENHIKIVCEIGENHSVDVHEPDKDMLFIE